jgi:hypothetical protein
VLNERSTQQPVFSQEKYDWATTSGVLFSIGNSVDKTDICREPCIILNKRSLKVRQPGDLCCPGGSVAPRLDRFLAGLFSLPIFSLGRWDHWSHWKKKRSLEAGLLALFWATSLRESFEEMRLNPFRVRFLGPLPAQSLIMFRRTIHPMVAWIPRQKRFYPNWEVEKIVRIPMKDLLKPENYLCYRLHMDTRPDSFIANPVRNFPCFRLQVNNKTEILWGLTYRITTVFLEYVFHFKPPGPDSLPVIEGKLNDDYLTGQR